MIIIYLKMVDKCLNGAFRISFRLGPSIGTQAFIAIQKGFIRSPISESSAADSQILHQTQIFHLIKQQFDWNCFTLIDFFLDAYT